MYYCSNYTLAVALCVVTMFCWGSWGNTQKLAGKTWRYELFYWDYVVGILAFSLVMGFTMGSCGENAQWGFLANLKSSFGKSWLWPFASGIVFNLSNILLAAAIAVAGMSVAFPVGVGLALVGGTILNYAVKKQGSLALIVVGLVLIVSSIVCNALAFKAKQGDGGDRSATKKGLVLALLAGLLMMWFSPLVNKVIDLTFTKAAPEAGMMTPYTGFFLFAIGIFVSNFVFNTVAMRKPVQGEPILDGAKRYFGGSIPTHLVGVLGGCIWGLGTLLSFVSGGAAGPAISYALGQGATLVSALWGILVWKEFKGAPKKSGALNLAMIILFLVGLLGRLDFVGKFGTHEFNLVAEFLGHENKGFGVEALVDGYHQAQAHACSDYIVHRGVVHKGGEVVYRNEFGDFQHLLVGRCLLHLFLCTLCGKLALLLAVLSAEVVLLALVHLRVGFLDLLLDLFLHLFQFGLGHCGLEAVALAALAGRCLLLGGLIGLSALLLVGFLLDVGGFDLADVHLLGVDAFALLLFLGSFELGEVHFADHRK